MKKKLKGLWPVMSRDLFSIFISLWVQHRCSYRLVSYKSMFRLLLGRLSPRGQSSCPEAYIVCSTACRSSCQWICPSLGQTRDHATCLLAHLISGDIKPTVEAKSWQDPEGPRALESTHAVSWAGPPLERWASHPETSCPAGTPLPRQSLEECQRVTESLKRQGVACNFLENAEVSRGDGSASLNPNKTSNEH